MAENEALGAVISLSRNTNVTPLVTATTNTSQAVIIKGVPVTSDTEQIEDGISIYHDDRKTLGTPLDLGKVLACGFGEQLDLLIRSRFVDKASSAT